MQKFKFDFLENEFWSDVLRSISKTLHNFSTCFFSMYRGILEPKNNISISRKNGSFANRTCCGLTALAVKTRIYFYCCNFVNKQINKNSWYCFFFFRIDCSQQVEPKIFRKMFLVLEMESQINGHLLKMSPVNVGSTLFERCGATLK